MADVFLSYSSLDRAMAAHIQAALEAAGLTVFWDQETPVGQDWNRWIGEKLAQSRVCVVLWSAASVASRNVVHEATIAHGRGALIPAVIEALKPEQFPMGFYTVQGADLTGFRGQAGHPGMARLIAAVRETMRGQAGAPPPPAGAPIAATKAAPEAGVRGLVFWGAAFIGLAVTGAVLIGGANLIMQAAPTPPVVAPAPAAETAPKDAPENLASGISVGAELEYLMALEGRWTWTGQPCAKGPKITLDNGALIFTTPDSRFVHDVGEVTRAGVVNTIVSEPAAFKGDVYTLTRAGNQLTVTLMKQPPDINVWTRCGD